MGNVRAVPIAAPMPLSLRSKTSLLKAAPAPAAARTAVRIAVAWRRPGSARPTGSRSADVAARHRGGDVDLGLLRRPGHDLPCTTREPIGYPIIAPRIARPLLRWYDRSKRDLPWRRDPSPYKTLVSEFMLQQTVVATVVPYFNRFIARFPDVGALAAASDDDVTALWSGLGYYARARNLRRAAAASSSDHGGALPASEQAFGRCRGSGPTRRRRSRPSRSGRARLRSMATRRACLRGWDASGG